MYLMDASTRFCILFNKSGILILPRTSGNRVYKFGAVNRSEAELVEDNRSEA